MTSLSIEQKINLLSPSKKARASLFYEGIDNLIEKGEI